MRGVLIESIDIFFRVIYFAIFIRIILSWLPMGSGGTLASLIHTITEPILGPIRNMIDKSPIGGGMMLDFSPVIALFVMNLAKMVLVSVVLAIF